MSGGQNPAPEGCVRVPAYILDPSLSCHLKEQIESSGLEECTVPLAFEGQSERPSEERMGLVPGFCGCGPL